MTVILGSGSPRRSELLGRLGVPFRVEPSQVDERMPFSHEPPEEYALALARQKGTDVAGRNPGQVVLSADTVVAIDDVILGKPVDAEDAERMLRLLRGRSHRVVTAVVVHRGESLEVGTVAATVVMRPFSDAEAAAYVATGEPMDKAGAYAVQGLGGGLVERVDGCYETVVGLPLCLATELLARAGVPISATPDLMCSHGR